jgi:prevent-host-death family protein
MLTIGAFEAKNRLSELLDAAENGKEIMITKHGRPVAKLVPADSIDRAKVREAIEWLKRTRKQRSLGGLSITDMIKEGRKY